MRRFALRAGLRLADLLVASLPAAAGYALADLAGAVWHRCAPRRRVLVSANLARVLAGTGRSPSEAGLRRLVLRAFVEYARYYYELLRAPHYPLGRVASMIDVKGWPELRATLHAGPTVLASPHLGNFEPFGAFLAANGISAVAPVEETNPPELFEFLRARRAGGRGMTVVPLSKAGRPLLEALRRGGTVGLIADRDLGGDGVAVQLFGHPTTMPTGPATLTVRTGSTLIVGSCLRVGRERFLVDTQSLPWQTSGDRRRDAEVLTRDLAARFELLISAAPEQWFAAFQPIWPDIGWDVASAGPKDAGPSG
ncbi:MAG: hypothetical protein DLM71_01180 [Chloroflexi bacterium]|nr:MAG: hypothetical protein DLM71_01180 [Chloroflexota bacterium]